MVWRDSERERRVRGKGWESEIILSSDEMVQKEECFRDLNFLSFSLPYSFLVSPSILSFPSLPIYFPLSPPTLPFLFSSPSSSVAFHFMVISQREDDVAEGN